MKLNESRRQIELHFHLDGAVRPSTLFELARKRNIPIPYSTVEELKKALLPIQPYSLSNFLQGFKILLPIIAGDKDALTRITTECIEDCVNLSSLCYMELRFAPYFFVGPQLNADEATCVVSEAAKRAGELYGIEVRLILCILRNHPETAEGVLQLAIKYKEHGVVAIDLAGDDSIWSTAPTPPSVIEVFKNAKNLGIHRTVHAGENSPPEAVLEAIDQLHAERIGHGYSIMKHREIYEYVLKCGVHLEICPTSSWLTGAVNPEPPEAHPVRSFSADGFSFSINTDAPLMTERWLNAELNFCQQTLGMTREELKRSQTKAALAAFLESTEDKKILLNHVTK